MAMTQYKYQLDEKDIPNQWYNVLADLSTSGGPLPPPLHPATHEPIERILAAERSREGRQPVRL